GHCWWNSSPATHPEYQADHRLSRRRILAETSAPANRCLWESNEWTGWDNPALETPPAGRGSDPDRHDRGGRASATPLGFPLDRVRRPGENGAGGRIQDVRHKGRQVGDAGEEDIAQRLLRGLVCLEQQMVQVGLDHL